MTDDTRAAPTPEASAPGDAERVIATLHQQANIMDAMAEQDPDAVAVAADLRWAAATVAALTAERDALQGAGELLARGLVRTEAERDALREVVESFALVERHSETRANGSSDCYRMPFRGASWFDSPEAAVTDWLAARAAPRGDAAP